MTVKEIVIPLTDDEWKELLDTVRHELGESLTDEEIENIVKREVGKSIRDTYICSLQ